jgi:hypothetical protein
MKAIRGASGKPAPVQAGGSFGGTMKAAEESQPENATRLDVVWGVSAIAKVIGLTERQTSYLLKAGRLPGKKKGRHWISSVSALREELTI